MAKGDVMEGGMAEFGTAFGVICLIIFVSYWNGYGSAFEQPEPQQFVIINETPKLIAQENGLIYFQSNNMSEDLESENKTLVKASWGRLLEKATDKTNSTLVVTFSRQKNYYPPEITQQCWILQKAGMQVPVVSKLSNEFDYAIPQTKWGPLKMFSMEWKANITDNKILFNKPNVEEWVDTARPLFVMLSILVMLGSMIPFSLIWFVFLQRLILRIS